MTRLFSRILAAIGFVLLCGAAYPATVTCGDATHVSKVTINTSAKGQLVSVTCVPVAIAFPAPTPAPTPIPIPTPTPTGLLLGVMNDDTEVAIADHAKDLAALVSLNAKTARNNIDWGGVEASQGNYNWSTIDDSVNGLVSVNILPTVVLYGSPAWANGNSDHLVIPSGAAFAPWVAAYAKWAGLLATHLKGRVAYYELWNEQNDIYFWKPTPNLQQYEAWFKAVDAAIRVVDPGAHTLLGGMSGLCCTGPAGINGFNFLKGLYQDGVFPEIVAIHPYSGDLSPDDTTLWTNQYHDVETIRSIMVAAGQSDKPIWITELGWLSDNVGETLQAQYTARAIDIARQNWPYVRALQVFALRPIPGVGSWSILNADWSFKPAANAFQAATAK